MAGVGWVRYAYAVYLLMAGLNSVILSIEMGTYGGAALILGALEIVSAGALATSVSVMKYLEDRRRKGVPWLQIGLAIVGLFGVLIGLFVYDVVRAQLAVHQVQQDKAIAVAMLQKFAPDMDLQFVTANATDELKQQLAAPGFAEQFAAAKAKLGSFRRLDDPEVPGIASIVIKPPTNGLSSFNVTLHYEHGDLHVWVEEDNSGPTILFCTFEARMIAQLKPQ
jgi:hypothetical protein